MHQLWLPLLLATGAYFMTQSLMAVAIACGTLAYIHINSASPFWVESTAYPIIVLLSIAVIMVTLIGRFANVSQPPMKPAGRSVATQIKTIRDEGWNPPMRCYSTSMARWRQT